MTTTYFDSARPDPTRIAAHIVFGVSPGSRRTPDSSLAGVGLRTLDPFADCDVLA